MKRYAPLLLALALLLGAALGAGAATAAPSSAPTVPTSFAPELHDAALELEEAEEEDEEDFSLEDCTGGEPEFEDFGDDEIEFEEEEIELEECGDSSDKASANEAFVAAPAACLVRRAESKVTTLPASDSLQLTVRYTTYSPTSVNVGLKLKDRKGSLGLGQATKHFGAHGVLQLTTKLGQATMERVEAAGEFDVSLLAPRTPGFCGDLLTQRLRQSKGKEADKAATASRVYRAPRS